MHSALLWPVSSGGQARQEVPTVTDKERMQSRPPGEDPLAVLGLDQLLRTIPSGLFLVDLRQRIVHWNPEAERITGFRAEEAVGRHCSFLKGIPCGKGCGLYDENMSKPIIGVFCTVRAKDGRRLHLVKNVDYLRDAAGEVVGGIESFVDITRRVALESRIRRHARELEGAVRNRTAELEEERTQLRNVLDAMADFAYICDPDYTIRFMNRALVAAVGEQVGARCYRALYGLEAPCGNCPMGSVLAGESSRVERSFPATGRTYEVLHTRLRGREGGARKLAVFRDVTERRRALERLRVANRELDAFVHTVSHDLRTPLAPIIGFADFLLEEYGGRLDEQGRDLLQEIEGQGRRMLALLEDLLLLAQVGRVALPETPVECGPVVEKVVVELSGEAAQGGLEVRIGPLPAIRMPETLLSEIFGNLIGNALRYAAGSSLPVEVGGEKVGEQVRFFVRDHGPGVPAGEREKIFELFHRGSHQVKVKGTGIGLAIVRKICQRFGGRVWVEETPGGGATFRVELPADPKIVDQGPEQTGP